MTDKPAQTTTVDDARRKKLTPYQRIMVAAKRGSGVRISALEVQYMSLDTPIRDLAWTDDHAEDER